jgi:tetratricopeptide (TPR) repeat protein
MYYNEALAIDPGDVSHLYNKGLTLTDLGKYEEAITYYDKVLAINSTDFTLCICVLYANKGLSLDALGKYEEAITYYDKALAINSNSSSPYDPSFILNNKGLALDHLGKAQEAITYYDKALALDADDAEVLYNKGLALDHLGKTDEAMIYYNKSLSMRPNSTQDIPSTSIGPEGSFSGYRQIAEEHLGKRYLPT